MSDFVLIDPPVTPFSTHGEILLWVDICRLEVSKYPESQEWKAALLYAESLVHKQNDVQ